MYHEFFFNASLTCTPEVYIISKKVKGLRVPEVHGAINLYIYILFKIQSLYTDKCL